MSLDLAGLKTNIKAALDATKATGLDAATAEQNYVDAIAEAIDTYVKTASIIYTSGLAAPGGAVTGVFEGELQ